MFVSRLKEIRIKRKMSQRQIGLIAKISQSSVHNIEHNIKSTTFHTIEKLAKSLGIPAYSLFSYRCDSYKECKLPNKGHPNCYEDTNCKSYKNTIYIFGLSMYSFYCCFHGTI